MFGVDFSELMVILVVALIVLGPERLPKVARTCGLLWARAQRFITSIKSDIDNIKTDVVKGMSLEEIHQMQQKINEEVLRAEQAANQLTQAMNLQAQQLNSSLVQPVTQATQDIASQVKLEPPPAQQKKSPAE